MHRSGKVSDKFPRCKRKFTKNVAVRGGKFVQRLIVGGSYTQSGRATVADGAGAGGSANEVEILHHSAESAGHCLSLHNKDEEKKRLRPSISIWIQSTVQ